MQTTIGTRKEIGEYTYTDMLRLRHKVFHERLNWDMPSTTNDPALEEDVFDTDETVYVIIGKPAVACCRLIPTNRQTMISLLWPDVLHDELRNNVDWELSRFAADRDARQPGLLSAMILHEAYGYAIKAGIQSYIVISTPPAAKVIRRMGIKTERLASADTSIVASRTPITDEVGALLRALVSVFDGGVVGKPA